MGKHSDSEWPEGDPYNRPAYAEKARIIVEETKDAARNVEAQLRRLEQQMRGERKKR